MSDAVPEFLRFHHRGARLASLLKSRRSGRDLAAEWLRVQGTTTAHQFDPMLPATVPAGSPLADAVSVLGAAASAVVRTLGPIAPP